MSLHINTASTSLYLTTEATSTTDNPLVINLLNYNKILFELTAKKHTIEQKIDNAQQISARLKDIEENTNTSLSNPLDTEDTFFH